MITDSLFVNPAKSSKELMPNALHKLPCEGAEEILLFVEYPSGIC